MNIDLDKLEQVARAATPGIWERNGEAVDSEDGSIYNIAVCQHARCAESWSGTDYAAKSYQLSNADFIAQVNPAVVLELVRRLRAAEADAKRLDHVVESECMIENAQNTNGDARYWLVFPNTGEHQRGVYNSPRAAIDAAIAAQGASHD